MPLSDYLRTPTSFRLRQELTSIAARDQYTLVSNSIEILKGHGSSHPSFGHLSLLVFEAVLEVVCVSLPGYIVARYGLFDAESQKFLANLNVMLFTPCLIFTKLASQLTAEKLAELAIIPLIFVVQTIISYICALIVSKCFGFKKRQKSFVIAMGVFGNSNSLPISLVISLSQTLKGLHWDKIPGDNDNEVGARGILYLLIFQQLGQLVRWTWGYNVLLAPADRFTEAEGGIAQIGGMERGRPGYRDEPETDRLISPLRDSEDGTSFDDDSTQVGDSPLAQSDNKSSRTPRQSASSSSSIRHVKQNGDATDVVATPANGNIAPPIRSDSDENAAKVTDDAPGVQGAVRRIRRRTGSMVSTMSRFTSSTFRKVFDVLPTFMQKALSKTANWLARFFAGLWEFMNPPLWAMLIAIVVASIPDLQHLFFDDGTFIRNSVTRAVQQSGGVAVPLILVVLGGNLARNTLPKDSLADVSDAKEERNLLIASLISRMLLPTIIMAPLLALTAKYISVSILDDKIFIIVCFLLTGAPTALQLAQICQINNVYMPVMSKILFQSYVIWILPSTLVLVLLALETVEWAERQ